MHKTEKRLHIFLLILELSVVCILIFSYMNQEPIQPTCVSVIKIPIDEQYEIEDPKNLARMSETNYLMTYDCSESKLKGGKI